MTQPNIVLIMCDQQGANAVGCYGAEGVRTERIDQLASEGTRFARAYTATPVCTPARAGLHTGMYPHSAGGWSNAIGLDANTKTVAQRLAQAGYHCAHFGKWHLDGHDYFGTGQAPEPFTQETWFDGRNYLEEFPTDFRPKLRKHPGSPEAIRELGITEETTWGGRICRHSLDFIADASKNANETGQPFFMVASFDEPHGPSISTAEDLELFADFVHKTGPAGQDDLTSKPSHQFEWSRAHNPDRKPLSEYKSPKYFAANHFVDRLIGKIVDAVDEHCADNTWIVYTTDHGDFLGAHCLGAKGPAMYDDITKVPFIVRPPPSERKVQVIDEPVSLVDIVPTILNIAKAPCPPILDGHNLLPAVKQGSAKERGDVLVEFNRFEVGHDGRGGLMPIRCLIRGQYKFVINLHSEDELYDHAVDPYECTNFLEDPNYTEIRNELHQALLTLMDEQRDPFRGAIWERRPWQQQRSRGWTGPERQRPDDGFMPSVWAYPTGLPPESSVTKPG